MIFRFPIIVQGDGKTAREAFRDACEGFALDPGSIPEDYTLVEDDENYHFILEQWNETPHAAQHKGEAAPIYEEDNGEGYFIVCHCGARYEVVTSGNTILFEEYTPGTHTDAQPPAPV